ncbi:hypothetical protein [Paraburkholderia sp. BCC1884]|uniref:hypothetical protein n=1 Tax=Paraburkholderia sp. BCC1884 TaxID=2562668 RepID=UPI0011838399|nr:hypothetical protein [Paraburkholderia sp. BCC1884]
MKLVQSFIVAAALAIPAVSSFAQSNPSVNPATDFGGVVDGTSASGAHQRLHAFDSSVLRVGHKIQGSIRPDANHGMKPLYFGS